MHLLCLLALLGCGSTPSGALYLAGREPGTLTRVDTATGVVSTRTGLRRLGGGDPPYFVHFTGGRLVTFALGRATSFAPDITDPKSLGESWYYVPSSSPGRVWNVLTRFRGVRETTVQGQVTLTRRWKVPGWVSGAVDDGIVIQRKRLEVWDPRTRRLVRRLPATFPVAFRGHLVASCEDPCRRLYVNDRAIRGPFAVPYRGAFSADGTLLAVPATHQRIAIVNVESGTVDLIPGARTDPYYGSLTWASSGWLFYNAGNGKLGAWRPGEPARLLRARVPKLVDMTSD